MTDGCCSRARRGCPTPHDGVGGGARPPGRVRASAREVLGPRALREAPVSRASSAGTAHDLRTEALTTALSSERGSLEATANTLSQWAARTVRPAP